MLERLLLVVGLASLGYYGYVSAETALYQAFETRRARRHSRSSAPAPDCPVGVARPAGTTTAAGRWAALGRLEIPRLNVSVIVRAGSDARTLRLAVGHIGGTSLPGEPGNIGLAAHRDTFFRRLGEIRADDLVRLVTADGTYVYRVEARRWWSHTTHGS